MRSSAAGPPERTFWKYGLIGVPAAAVVGALAAGANALGVALAAVLGLLSFLPMYLLFANAPPRSNDSRTSLSNGEPVGPLSRKRRAIVRLGVSGVPVSGAVAIMALLSGAWILGAIAGVVAMTLFVLSGLCATGSSDRDGAS